MRDDIISVLAQVRKWSLSIRNAQRSLIILHRSEWPSAAVRAVPIMYASVMRQRIRVPYNVGYIRKMYSYSIVPPYRGISIKR